MPIIFTNWKLNKEGLNVLLESWVPSDDHSRFRSMRAISKFYTTQSSTGIGVRGGKPIQYHQYVIPLNDCKIKQTNLGSNKGWTITINGESILIMFNSRTQNHKYHIQSLEEIEGIINEVVTGIPVVQPASSSEIVSQIVNSSLKDGTYVQLQVPKINCMEHDDSEDLVVGHSEKMPPTII